MSNLDLTQKTLKEQARKVANLQKDDYEIAVGKLTDINLLREVYLLVDRNPNVDRVKMIKARAKSIGATLE